MLRKIVQTDREKRVSRHIYFNSHMTLDRQALIVPWKSAPTVADACCNRIETALVGG